MTAPTPHENGRPLMDDPSPTEICPVSALRVERGSAALLPDGTQIGVFLLEDGSVHAIQQFDPYSRTNILSRGLIGSHEMPGTVGAEHVVVPTIASPMYKQTWNLATGEVIDAGGGEPRPIDVFDTEVRDGRLFVTPRLRTGTESER